jgi:hypothetical protein
MSHDERIVFQGREGSVAVPSANRPRHFVSFATEISERGQSISSSFSGIGDSGRTGALLERELLLSLVMNGVKYTGGSLREVSMGTALAVTQQQSIEAAARSWARIHSTDRCPRCGGLMVAEWCQDLSDYSAQQRCVQCGELIDPVILENRRL